MTTTHKTTLSNDETPQKCPQCTNTFENDSGAVGCDGNCKQWYHKDCTTLTATEFNALKSKKGNLLWMCSKCRYQLDTFGVNKSYDEDKEMKKEIKQAVTKNKTTCDEIQQKLDEMSQTLIQKMSLILEAQLQQADYLTRLDDSTPRQDNPPPKQQRKSVIQGNGEKPENEKDKCQLIEDKQNTTCERSTENTAQNDSVNSIDREKQSYNEGKWPQVARRNRTPQRNKQVVGTKTNTGDDIQAAQKTAWLFIGRLKEDTSPDSIIKYLQKNSIMEVIECEEVETRGRTKAFKLGIPFRYLEEIEDPGFWPEGIIIRRFRFRRTYHNKGISLE